MDRINHTPNFFHFKNQQSSLDNHHSKSTASDFFSTIHSLPSNSLEPSAPPYVPPSGQA